MIVQLAVVTPHSLYKQIISRECRHNPTLARPRFVATCFVSFLVSSGSLFFFLSPVMIQTLYHTLPHSESPCGVPFDFSLVWSEPLLFFSPLFCDGLTNVHSIQCSWASRFRWISYRLQQWVSPSMQISPLCWPSNLPVRWMIYSFDGRTRTFLARGYFSNGESELGNLLKCIEHWTFSSPRPSLFRPMFCRGFILNNDDFFFQLQEETLKRDLNFKHVPHSTTSRRLRGAVRRIFASILETRFV